MAVSHLTAILPSSLSEYSSPALTSLVALHGELGLHPTDVETTSSVPSHLHSRAYLISPTHLSTEIQPVWIGDRLLTRLDTLSQTSTELEIDVLVARQALNVLTKEQIQMSATKEDIDKSVWRPPA